MGLGLGSYVVGRWSDRLHERDPRSPLLVYGLFELALHVHHAMFLAIISTSSMTGRFMSSMPETAFRSRVRWW